MKQSPEKVAIVGRGYLPLMCAAYMAKQFAPMNLQITVVQVGKNIDPPAISSLGSFGDFLQDLSVSPTDFLRETGAECNLAYCYKGWRGGDGREFRLCNAEYGFLVKGIRFHQLFERYRELGEDAPLDNFCLAAVTAKLGRIGFASPNSRSIYSTLKPDYRVATDRLYPYFERLVASMGISMISGELQHVGIQGEQLVDQLTLEDGRIIAADLFLDLTKERLISGAQGRSERSVVEGLPPIISSWQSSDAAGVPTGEIELLAGENCIRKILRIGGTEYCQTISVKGSENASQTASPLAAHHILFDSNPWIGNCIALGAAFAEMPGILVENSHFVQSAMNRLYVLWPKGDGLITVAEIFNQEAGQELERAGEIDALHLKAINGNFSWSDSLKRRIELFEELGKLPFLEREILQDYHWIGLFYALGYSPKGIDPQAYAVSDEFVVKELEKMRSLFHRAASELPMYGDFTRQVKH